MESMSPYVPVPNTVSAELIFTQSGQKIENVFHVSDTGGWDVAKMTLLASDLKTWWNTQLKTTVVAPCALSMIRVKDLTTDTAPGIEYSIGMPIAGTDATAAANLNVTFAVKWSTGLSGRWNRGRTFHCGAPANTFTNSVMSNAVNTTYVGAYTALITNVNVGTRELVIVSRRFHNSPRLTGTATPVLNCSIDTTGDSQRRRLPGRGR